MTFSFVQFGHSIPVFKEEQFGFVPLSEGYTELYDPSGKPPPNINRYVYGQFLTGTMIPKRIDSGKEFKALQKQKELKESQSSGKEEMEPLLEGNKESSSYGAVDV